MKITEANLIQNLKHKNPKALDFLVDNYGNLLYKVIYNVLGNYGERGLMEECLNDVFLSIWDNIDSFSGEEEKLKKWICVVAKYKAIDYVRRLSKDKETVALDDCTIISDFETESEILSQETQSELLELINEMNDIDKKIFIMKYFLDDPINEICESLSLTRSAVDTRLSRGRKTLKQILTLKKEEEYNNEKIIQAL